MAQTTIGVVPITFDNHKVEKGERENTRGGGERHAPGNRDTTTGADSTKLAQRNKIIN